MTGLMVLADGFEDTEALTTRDILKRAGIEVILCSISNSIEVTSSFGVHIKADCFLKELKVLDNYSFIILPGGGQGTRNLKNCEYLKAYLDYFILKEKLVCAICAAPSVLGEFGYLQGHKYTCYAGFNKPEYGNFTGKEVETSENIITGRSMLYSIKIGLEIVNYLLGKAQVKVVQTGIEGLSIK